MTPDKIEESASSIDAWLENAANSLREGIVESALEQVEEAARECRSLEKELEAIWKQTM